MAQRLQIRTSGGDAQTVPDFAEMLAILREDAEHVEPGTAAKVLSDATFDARSPASSAADRARKRAGKALQAEERVTTAVRKVDGAYRFWLILLSEDDAAEAAGYGDDRQGRKAFVESLATVAPEA